MAFNYKIVEGLLLPKNSVQNCPVYDVYEVPTDQVIKRFQDPKEAKKFMRHLNFGGGFDGWSPTFFLREVKITSN